jgi:exosortase
MTIAGRTIELRDAVFLLLIACSVFVFAVPLKTLVGFSLEYEHYSHIVLIPLVSTALVYMDRKRIFAQAQWSVAAGVGLIAAGIAVFIASRTVTDSWTMNDSLSLSFLGIAATWLGSFILCYGVQAFRVGTFPLLFLFLVVPIPDIVLQNSIAWLVKGSTEVSDLLFKLTGVPVYRNGAVFVLPGLTIEVAKECSGIRSSLALFITALIAGKFFLRSKWRRAALVAAALPILVVKNGLRIVTLTLLAIYVDPGFLAGGLHRRGGVVFFVLGLIILWPVLRILEKTEKKAEEHVPGQEHPMRVCMLAYTFYETDNRVMRYAETLAKRGAHVDVIALRREVQPDYGTLNGVHVYRIQGRQFNEKGPFSYLFRILRFLFRSMLLLGRKHLRERYDLIHVHSVPDFLVFAAWIPKVMGCRIILDIHDLLPEFYGSKFRVSSDSVIFKALVIIERFSAAFSDHVIIANHLWQKKLLYRCVENGKCTVVLNVPDRTLFHPTGRTRNDGKFIILFPGTLNWHQGLDIAIQAFSLIKDQAPHAELHIYGEGSAKESLLQLIRQLGLENRVLMFGVRPLQEIPTLIENSDLGVVPKRKDPFGNEAFSTKILEFMALGVPVVVSDTKIDRYYFNESVVRFFRGGDENDLAEAILQLIRDQRLREQLVRNAAQFVTGFDWAKTKSEYFALVDSLVSRQACPPK